MPLYREDLDRGACAHAGCADTQHDGEMWFHARCHPRSPTWVHYRADVLTIVCAECNSVIGSVVVASRGADP